MLNFTTPLAEKKGEIFTSALLQGSCSEELAGLSSMLDVLRHHYLVATTRVIGVNVRM